MLDQNEFINRLGYEGITPYIDDVVAFAEIMLKRISVIFENFNYDEQNNNVKEIQKVLNLPQTGVIDKSTWNGIVNLYESIND